MINDIVKDLDKEISDTHHGLKMQLAKLRTGRANIAVLDGVRIDYYGTPTPLSQVAQISATDPRMITIKPWEKKLTIDIERAIMASKLGLNPQSDGEIIRLPIPQLTEERRKELVKQARTEGEKSKVALRNHRRNANEMLKELEKDKEISEDDLKRALEQVQEIIDKGITDVEGILGQKEREIIEI